MEWSNERLAWCAGFIDGEGCFSTRSNGTWLYPRLVVAQAQREELDKLQSAFGGKVYGPYERNRYGKPVKDIYQWQLYRYELVQQAICLLWPWLSTTKRNQAWRMMMDIKERDEAR